MTPTRKPRTRAAQKQLEATTVIDVEAIEDDEPITPTQLPAVREPAASTLPAIAGTPVTVADLQERLTRAKEFIQTALTPAKFDGPKPKRHDGDVGVIPGTGGKPVLLKGGAEKLARLFGLSVVAMERTAMERIDTLPEFCDAPIPGWMFGYQCVVAGPDGAVWGRAEAFTSHDEKNFHEYEWGDVDGKYRPIAFKALAPMNTLAARAQKRAYVRAVVQALGISSMVSTSFGETAPVISETQRAIVTRIYELVLPSQAERAAKNATKVTANQYPAFLGAAVESAADVRGWDEDRSRHAFRILSLEDASVEDVDAVMGVDA
jgi:hypothetical protein